MSADSRAPWVGRITPRRVAKALPLVLIWSCTWFTDFKQQPKIDPWESPADTIPPRGNPQNSVSIYGSQAPGFMFERAGMGGLTALKDMEAHLVNPTAPDSASVSRGRVLFQINCAVCHGPLGHGDGPATNYGVAKKPLVGPGADAETFKDGYIFGMIRNGRGLMPTYNRIEEPDRWDIVNYIRSLQGKIAIAADSSHGLPGQTGTFLPGATLTAPTRPAPYLHPGTPVAAPAKASAPAENAKGGKAK